MRYVGYARPGISTILRSSRADKVDSNPRLGRRVHWTLALTVAIAAQFLAPAAMAQVADDACPADVAGRSVQCVSQDVSLASVDYEPGNLPSSCVAGTEIPLDVRLGFVVNANARRYDIATWIAKVPGDIKLPSPVGPSSCSLLTAQQQYLSEIPDPPLPSVPNPVPGVLIVDDIDGDACYDTLPAAKQYFAADFPNGLRVTCQPGPSGTLTFQTLVSWSTQSTATCDGTPTSFVGEVSNSKCAAGSPITLPVNVLSRLIIEKQTIPDGLPDVFDFSGTIAGSPITPFQLDDDGETELTGALDATYVISETIPDGFEIDSIVCTNQTTGSPANVTANAATGQVTVVMSGSQFDVRCVYTNDQLPATLTVVKNTNGGDDSFDFSWFSTNNPSTDFQLATSGGTAEQTFQIETGLGDTDFVVAESLTQAQVDAGWVPESAQCVFADDPNNPVIGSVLPNGDGAVVAGLTLNAGDDVTCTFVNNAPAQLTVSKIAQGGDDTFLFGAIGLPAPNDNFSITTNSGSGSNGPITVPIPDSSTGVNIDIAEDINNPAGWNLVDITCSGTDETVIGNLVDIILQPGDVVDCTFTNVKDGQITLVKTSLGSDRAFGFVTDIPGANSPITLTTTDNTASASIATPPPGSYFISEAPPNGWDLTDISCSGATLTTFRYEGSGGGSDTDAFEPGDETVIINLAAGEDISCTFENTQRGAIVIRKETDPVSNTGDFGFTSTSGPATAIPSPFTVTAGGDVTFSAMGAGLLPGTYTVTEDDPTPGFDLTGLVCIESINPGSNVSTVDIPSRTATINLDPGELVTCTFTNTERANLTIQKAITVDFADTTALDNSFDFTSATLPNASFSLAPTLAAAPDSADFLNLVPGTYDVEEDELQALDDGWALVGATCTDGTDLRTNNFEVELSPGEDVTCTFINAPLGSSTIIKNTVGNVDGTFDYTGTAPFLGLSLATSSGTASQDYTNQLDPLDNPYVIIEDDPAPDGFELTALTCEEMGGTDINGDPVADNTVTTLAAREAEINADYNEMVTCTFTNTANGSITIRKQTAPDDVDQLFDFTSAEADLTGSIRDFDIAAEELVLDAQPGPYSATETVPLGWQVTGISCTGQTTSTVAYTGSGAGDTPAFEPGDDTVDVGLAAGEDVVCEFINTQESSITIVKQTVGGDGVFNFGSAALGNFALDTAANPSQDFQNLLPDTYLVAETPVPPLWDLTNIVCQGATDSIVTIGLDDVFTPGDTGITIDLAPGEDIVCTFENTQLVPDITILKEASPNSYGAVGDVISYTFTVTNSGTAPLTNVTVTDPLPNLGAIDCGGGTNVIAALIPGQAGSCSATYSIVQADLDAGSLSNTATAAGTAPDNSTVTATSTATVSSNQVPNIQITKVPSPTSYLAAGVNVTYTLTVTNPGNVTLSNVTVTDPLPGLGPIDCGGGSSVIGDMAPAAPPVVCTAVYTTTQADVDAGSIANTATAAGTAPDQSTVSATASATINSTALASIVIVKTPSPTTFAAAGELITYTLAVTNNGGVTLSNVTVTDPLQGLSAVDCGGGSNVVASMLPQQSVNCTATLTTTQTQVDAGSIANTATASATAPDQSSVSAIANATVRSTAVPSVAITKTPSPTSFTAAGELITYMLVVTNSGGVTLSNVTVTDPLTGLSAVDCGGGSNVIASMAPQQAANCTATLTTTQTQVDAGDIDNTATATGTAPDQSSVSAMGSATVTNNSVPGYTIAKTVTDVAGNGPSGTVSNAGDVISYQIVVQNTGSTTLNNVNVTDPLVTLSCSPAAPAVLLAGTSMTCTGSYAVTQTDLDNNGNPTPGSGVIANTATVSSDELPDETDSESVSLNQGTPVPPQAIPVNDRWALVLMALLLLAAGWYFRPAVRRNF